MHIPAIMSTTSLSFCSIRFFKTRIPLSLYNNNNNNNNNKTPILKTSTFLSTPTQTFFSFKPITFQRLPTKPSSSSSPPPPPNSFQPIEDLPPKLQEIVKLFQSVQEPKAKYEQLLFYAKNLKPLDAQFKTDENKVQGCVSQVWVRAYLDQERNVFYEADSDSVLTKGLAALLVHGFSGRPVNEVLRVSPSFIVLLGLQQKLTVSRNNGFLNMLKLMQKKALLLYVEAEKGASEISSIASSDSKDDSFINSNDSPATQSPGSDVNLSSELHEKDIELSSISSSDSKDDSFIENSSDSPATQSPGSDVNLSSELDDKDIELSSISSSDSKDDSFIENSSDSPATQPPGSDVNLSSELDDKDIELGGRGKRIKEKLEKELDPVELQVEDVSYQHAGHAGVRGSDGETHFNLKVVSKEFEGKSLVKRHRLIYNLLQEELQSGLHALSIVAKTPSEFNEG